MPSNEVNLRGWQDVFVSPTERRAGLFIDRDGTIIHNVPYLADRDQVRLADGIRDLILSFRWAGHAIIITTNQSGVARGRISHTQYRAVNARMLELLGYEAKIDAIYACPFHPDGNPPYNIAHEWRKPAPGMLLAAAADLNVDLSKSVMIGDHLSDMQCAVSAGVSNLVHVATGHGSAQRTAVLDAAGHWRTQNPSLKLTTVETLQGLSYNQIVGR